MRVRANGDVLLYDPASNTFAIRSAGGSPRSMFKPVEGIAYFYKQK
jgi:pyocin large subunit-like protein